MKAEAKTQPEMVGVAGAAPAQPFRQLLEQAAKDAQHPRAKAAEAGGGLAAQKARPAVATATGRATTVVSAGATPLARISLVSATTAELSRVTRGRIEAEANRLVEVRANLQQRATQAFDGRSEELTTQRLSRKERLVELITRELVAAFDEGAPSAAANDVPQGPAAARAQGTSAPGAASAPPTGGEGPAPSPTQELERTGERASEAVALIERIEVFVKSTQRPALELTLNNSLGARVEIERMGPGQVAIKLVGQRGPPTPEAVSRIREELAARGLKVAAMSVA